MAAFKRKDRPNEGYRIWPTLPKPWCRVGPWQTGFRTKRQADDVELWVLDLARTRPAIIDALVAGKFSLQDAWIARLRGTLDDMVRGISDPLIAEAATIQVDDERVRQGLRVIATLAGKERMSWLLTPTNVAALYAKAGEQMSAGSVRRSVHRAVAELLTQHYGKARRDQVFVDVEKPQQDDVREVRVTADELSAVISACTPVFRDLPVLAMLLAIDREPLLRITPRFFNEQLGTLEVLDRKTTSRPRVIELSTPALAILRQRCADRDIDEAIFHFTSSQIRNHWEAARDIAAGRPLRGARRGGATDPVGEKALDLYARVRVVTLPILRFKDLRHLLPTVWNALGLPAEDLKPIMGWARGSNMSERYTTSRIQGDRQNLDRVAAFLGLDRYPLRAVGE